MPFFYLGDLDPFGFDILINYTFGSKYQIFENLALPNITWIGLQWEDIAGNPSVVELDSLNSSDCSKLNQLMTSELLSDLVNFTPNDPVYYTLT